MNSSMELVGADYDESTGGFPATVQPIAGDDGNLQFTGWPQNHVKTHGHTQTYAIKNILLMELQLDRQLHYLEFSQHMVKTTR